MELPLPKGWRETLVDGNLLILIGLPVAILLQNAACFGILCGLTVLSSYLMGIYCCRCATRKLLPSFEKGFLPVAENDLATSFKKERVHRRMFTSRSIDRALDQLFCRIVEQYISAWYVNISSDTWFQFEIRSAIRRIVCDVYGRINQISLERFVLDKVLPICLAHAHAVTDHQNLEITRLHVAVHSRKSEVLYVQNLSKCILKFLLETCDLNCKSYAILLREIVSKSVILSLSDAICNPCVLNRLILRHLELNKTIFPNDGTNIDGDGDGDGDGNSDSDGDSDSDSEDNCGEGGKEIRLMCTFADLCKTNSNNVCLRPDVNSILKDQDLQNTFMCFLSSHNAEHVLQFCLDIASFNEKILKPELEAEELDDLYRDAWDLFSVYFSSYSPNCIQFHKDLASPLRKALSKDILKLRTTATLVEAYEYAFSILQSHCQDFHNSAEFYLWLYGRCDSHDHDVTCPQNLPLVPPSSSSSSSSPSSMLHSAAATKESFGRKTMAEIGQKFSKIKEALKTESVLDGRLYGGDFSSRAIEAQEFLYTEVGVDVQLAAATVGKNINAWKISVPSIDWRTDPATDAAYAVLVIRIVNENDGEWLVERRPADVHSLNAKLVALGDEMSKNLQLPTLELPKAQTVTPTMENVQMYEDYMKKLIECVELNDSELLYDFFTCAASRDSIDTDDDDDDDGVDGLDEEDDQVDDDDYENEESSIGKIFRKSVVPTLRKERGQNLESFVNSLISSCATTKYEWKDVGGVVGEKKSLNKKSNINLKSSQLYGNNFDVDASRTRETVLSGKAANAANQLHLSPFSLIIHIAYKIYNLRMEFVRILLCFKSIFGTLADRYIFKITNARLKSITNERNVAYFINTIEWAVFDNKTKYSQHEISDRVTKLLIGMNDNWLYSMYQLIFQTLQDAKKNKQLFYNLCDALMEELFSEIFTRSPDQ